MSNVTIAELPSAGTITGTELLELQQGSTSVQTLMNAMMTLGYYAQTVAEANVSVTPTNYQYIPGDPRRYGAVGGAAGSIPSTDDSAPFQTAVSTGTVIIPQGWAFKIVTGATHTGQLTMYGFGYSSQLYCDGNILTVTSGSSSMCDNFYMASISAPWLLLRNPASWGTTITTLTQSRTALGYQPTSNDPEFTSQATTWNTNYGTSWSTQNIGPTLYFTGAASTILISRIYGNFVRITMQDAIQSVIRDCNFRGGKGTFAAILVDNATNNIQRGMGNRVINNIVSYASFCGITWIANDNFQELNNQCFASGESGTQTGQAGSLQFTASVGGATSGTLTTPFTLAPSGSYQLGFSDGSLRTVTLTYGSSAVSWTGALTSVPIVVCAVWGVGGDIPSVMDPRNYKGLIQGNYAWDNYYDGLDTLNTYPASDASQSHHQLVSNYAWNNNGVGISTDGQFNSVRNNHSYLNGVNGIWGVCSYSDIDSNFCDSNNQRLTSSTAQISALGSLSNNKISNNFVNGAPSDNGYGIYAPPGNYGSNDLINNKGTGTAKFFAGNPGGITGVFRGNTDVNSGLVSPQSFIVEIINTGSSLQTIFYSDASASGPGRFDKISGAGSGGYTTLQSNTFVGSGGACLTTASNTNVLWLNTNAQQSSMALMNASIESQNASSTGEIFVAAIIESVTINSVAINRIGFQFTTVSGAFALNTTNITSGKGIIVRFNGEIA